MNQIDNKVIFLEALRDIIPSIRKQNDERLEKRIGTERLEDASDDLAGFIESGAGSLTKNERITLSIQMLRCLTRYMDKVGTPVTLKTIIDQMSLLGFSVDSEFPGYAEGKLLKYIILSR